jgi:filamentous hemagglutinin family protein
MKKKSAFYNSSSLYTGLLAGLMMSAIGISDAMANPVGGTVASGSATIAEIGKKEIINQTTNRVVIDWRSFDIGKGETTQFIQPDASSMALNRIGGQSPSQILGTLSANGKVVLVNPNGVFFGEGSTVNAAGVMVSTANISNENFNNGVMKFDQAGKAGATITVNGSITAQDGGLVALVAPNVVNNGYVVAKKGTTLVAGAETATIDTIGDGVYSLAVDKKAEKAIIEQNGVLQGDNVVLTTGQVSKVIDNLINTSDIKEAANARIIGKSIVLEADNVEVAGALDASNSAGKGGSVTVKGNSIKLKSTAIVDASGSTGGGTVDLGGKETTEQAATLTLEKGSTVKADATKSGNGGDITLWSDNSTFGGALTAKGGFEDGDGGKIEASGEVIHVLDSAKFDASAAHGTGGMLTFDPRNVTIIAGNTSTGVDGTGFNPNADNSTIGADTITNVLNTGTSVTITTGTTGSQAGIIDIAANLIKTAGGDATLAFKAASNILVENNIEIGSVFNKLNIQLLFAQAGNGISQIQSGSSLISNGGNIIIGNSATNYIANNSTIGAVIIDNAKLDASGGTGGRLWIQGASTNNFAGITVNESTLKNSGTGTIELDGFGSSSGTNGISVIDSTISAANGTTTLNAFGRAPNSNGLLLFGTVATPSSISATGTGTIILRGTSGGGTGTGITAIGNNSLGGAADQGIIGLTADSINAPNLPIQTTNMIAFSNAIATNEIDVGTVAGGTGLQVTQAMLNNANAPHIYIGGAPAGNIKVGTINLPQTLSLLDITPGNDLFFTGALTHTAGGDVTINASAQHIITDGASITSTSGALNLAFQALHYIRFNATTVNTNNGNVSLIGQGGDASGQGGVALYGTDINAGTGNVTVTGTAKANGLDGVDFSLSSVEATDIAYNGFGAQTAQDSYGLYLNGTLTAKDKITLNGTGVGNSAFFPSSSNSGIVLGNAIFNAPTILLNGTSAQGPAINTVGVANLTSTGAAGSISLTSNNGINYAGNMSADGNITLNANGNTNLSNGAISGNNVTLNTVNVALNHSTITAANTVDIANTGTFSTNQAQVLLGNLVELNQSAAGDVQNGIDGVNKASGSTLYTLDAGSFVAHAVIDGYTNFTLTGDPVNTTLSAAGGTPIITVNNGINNIITGFTIDGSGLNVGTSAISFNNSSGSVQNMTISGAGDAISATNSNTIAITGNTLTGTNSAADSGILFSNVTGDNFITGNTISTYTNGISLTNGSSADIGTNTVFNILNGVSLNASSASVHDNIFNQLGNLYHSATAVTFQNGSSGSIVDNTIFNQDFAGIFINNSNATITGNVMSGIRGDGIDLASSNNNIVSGNIITADSTSPFGNGMTVFDSTGNVLSNNTINNFAIGADVIGSNNTQFASNTITGNGTGVLVDTSTNTSFLNDSFISSTIGLGLTGSTGTTVTGATFNNDTTAFSANNGSTGTVIATSSFNNVGTGVVLNNGSSMQFGANTTSTFTNVGTNFVLAGGSMFGQVLDSSNNIFNGVLAKNFTLAQFNAAEAITSDFNSGVITSGTVFYTSFPSAAGPLTGAPFANVFLLQNENTAEGRFSVSGQTIEPTQPPAFTVSQTQLSLLAPAAGQGNPIVPSTEDSLANLSPAAGGNETSSELASLSPSAGFDCASGFLSGGYQTNYNPASCTQQNQAQ